MRASGAEHDRRERGIRCREPRAAHRLRFRRVLGAGASCDHLLTGACIAVELAEQGIAVFLSSICKLLDEAFDLLTGSIFECLGTTEVDGVGLNQLGIEPVLADELAEPVADLVPGAVSVTAPVTAPISVSTLGRELL